ncbi:hypothetical protein SAMN04487970_10856 [Paenibacillus tianmuensis]|uniref:Uncharacterized protein n=1 Tax=Paenibacillus tianmuensis TaxID=624147 RepID=A0A1G4U058_9BACL|nr:hypothetical protein [Paenibacillus tianmuensis]SCW87036.1 hypothetical protein SAMN04487970_10856 [Paenibacillus tianmuensis]
MPNLTQNFNFKKPLQTENYDIDVQNSNWDKVDAVIPLSNMARQAIINGNFDVWQRGTTFTNPANLQYTADRYMWASVPDGGTNPILVHSRLTLASGEIPNSYFGYRINSNGSGSSYGASSLHWFSQPIEFGTRYLCGNGKKVTVSLWARSDIPGKKLGFWLRQTYGTGGAVSASEVINGASWTLGSVWAKYSFTFSTNTLASKVFSSVNNDMLEVAIAYQWGTAFASRVGTSTPETFVGAGNIDIAQVQLCAGDVALPFQPRSFAEELQLCQRYYERYDGVAASTRLNLPAAVAYDSNTFRTSMLFRVPKRVAPTMTQGGVFRFIPSGIGTNIHFFETTPFGTGIGASTSGATVGNSTVIQSNDTGGWIAADAEL